MDPIKATFQALIADLKHKKPELAGTPPGTNVKLETAALEVEVAAKLFELANGHMVNVTIEQIQERMPLEGDQPQDQPPLEETPADAEARLASTAREEGDSVPKAFREAAEEAEA